MTPRVLVVARDRGLGYLLETVVLDRAQVVGVLDPDETEGLGVVAVVVDEDCGSGVLRQLAVHPGLSGKPIISLGPNDPATPNVFLVDRSGGAAIEEIVDALDRVICGAPADLVVAGSFAQPQGR